MYKTYLLGNGGYAQECFEQFVLGGVVQDFGGFIILKNDKAILLNEDGVNDFEYPEEASFVLGTGQRKWRKIFLDHMLNHYEQDINHFPNIIANEAHLSQTSRLGVGNVLNCFALINANAEIGNFNLVNCYASVHHSVKMGNHNILSTYATVLGYCTVGDDNWLGSGTTITQRINIGKDNTLSSGEHLFDNLSDRKIFQSGVIVDKPEENDSIF